MKIFICLAFVASAIANPLPPGLNFSPVDPFNAEESLTKLQEVKTPAPTPVAAPVPLLPQLSNPIVTVDAPRVENEDEIRTIQNPYIPVDKEESLRANNLSDECPKVAKKSLEECVDITPGCWKAGGPDVDCAQGQICCYNGCTNTCISVSKEEEDLDDAYEIPACHTETVKEPKEVEKVKETDADHEIRNLT